MLVAADVERPEADRPAVGRVQHFPVVGRLGCTSGYRLRVMNANSVRNSPQPSAPTVSMPARSMRKAALIDSVIGTPSWVTEVSVADLVEIAACARPAR